MDRSLIDSLQSTGQSPLLRHFSAKFDRKKSRKIPTLAPSFHILYHHALIINNTLAGVAQLVERVALMTAKRSTSRSWVRAPPSAIPIISSSEQLFFLLFGSPPHRRSNKMTVRSHANDLLRVMSFVPCLESSQQSLPMAYVTQNRSTWSTDFSLECIIVCHSKNDT